MGEDSDALHRSKYIVSNVHPNIHKELFSIRRNDVGDGEGSTSRESIFPNGVIGTDVQLYVLKDELLGMGTEDTPSSSPVLSVYTSSMVATVLSFPVATGRANTIDARQRRRTQEAVVPLIAMFILQLINVAATCRRSTSASRNKYDAI